ncbi:UDP-2,4-diacetamido-2,4,6-trideoxy-beta-L-altropyranose hydrolase [Halomonas sp. HP20-15]|uniref:UDP-2,4-diacetamido-2,4, 6-trideoxy-beta-L-altropyranose hydrolase n=1 Tax=Halomonas sp. HP20-15 TaxID=3085901 RepID=UPI002980F45A|nr:UDP-2,4-diacetamido-2,4,6-trideoxy-beta-L-altropyranose hydrolase [Halomonas sp. HP20-15]MDW5378867.1 UDP-2,4-diacetamido-2,4,6-trideoxy-beta-L-altropyranose hydrolase [Halomonas sp. HP20-15]
MNPTFPATRCVAFRTDASLAIGTGHVMRCLTLANALKARQVTCHFICRDLPGQLIDAIRRRGHEAHVLPESEMATPATDDAQEPAHAGWLTTDWRTDAEQTLALLEMLRPEWLVVDHYALDARWQNATRPGYGRLFVIDDLADRPHAADLLLDQNLGREARDYAALVPSTCELLIGPQYALLRPEFAEYREASLARRERPSLGNILITMGGIDKDNATGRVLEALESCPLPSHCKLSVVMGANAPWLASVQAQALEMPWETEVAVNVNDMARRMSQADLAIGAAGSTSWERCCLGVPSLTIILAENQRKIAEMLDRAGIAVSLGEIDQLTYLSEHWAKVTHPEALKGMSSSAAQITAGQGARHVSSHLMINS